MRDVKEFQFELREIADDLRTMRARLIRLGDELECEHGSKEEARRVITEHEVAPDVPTYLLALVDMLEDEDLKKAEATLRQACVLDDQQLAKIWSERTALDLGGERPL